MTAFSTWTLIGGAYLVLAGVLILVAVYRHRKSRGHQLPARGTADAFATGRVQLPRAAGVRGPARGRTVVAARRAGDAATTLPFPKAPAAPPVGGYRAGWAATPMGPAGPHTVRLDGAASVAASGRYWVPAPGRGCGAGTPPSTRLSDAIEGASGRAVPGRTSERWAWPGTLSTPVPARPRADGARGAGLEPGRDQTTLLLRVSEQPTEVWTRAGAQTPAR